MSEKIKRNFATLDEAMSSLPKKTYEHSVRVAAYMRVLFLQACAAQEESNHFGSDEKANARLKEKNVDFARDIGYYHDIGKAMLPEEYQNESNEYSREEQALYEKHVSDSMLLIENFYRKETKCRPFEENYVREAISFHHERWSGTGFPSRLSQKNIPLLARMLSICDVLDHKACETISEHPFEDAVAEITSNKSHFFDPQLTAIVRKSTKKLKRVFSQHLKATRIIPATLPFVKLTADRPYCLWYRPIEDLASAKTIAVEAEARFKAKKLWLTYPEVADVMAREKLSKDLGTCIALEACDIIRRFANCKIEIPYVVLSFPTKWFNYAYAVPSLLSCLKDAEVAPDRICVAFSKDDFGESRAYLKKNIAALHAAGVHVLFDSLTLENVPLVIPADPVYNEDGDVIPPEKQPEPQLISHNRKKENGVITIEEILEFMPNIYRIGPADAPQQDNDAFLTAMKSLINAGVEIMAKDVELHEYKGLFYDLSVRGVTGNFCGEAAVADDFIRAELSAMAE